MFDYQHIRLQKYDPKFDLRIYIGHSDLYFIAPKLYRHFFSRFCSLQKLLFHFWTEDVISGTIIAYGV